MDASTIAKSQTNTPNKNITNSSHDIVECKANNVNSPQNNNKDMLSKSVNSLMTEASENFGKGICLNFDTNASSENFCNLSNISNLANLNLNPNLNINNMSNLNNMNNNNNQIINANMNMQPQGTEFSMNQDSKKKKKPFVERVGDWVCIKCKNLNFSFRVICNRCQLTKAESDKLFEQYMKNLMNYVKINEIIQNQIMNYPHLNTNFINQISNIDMSSQQGLSDYLIKNNVSLDSNGSLKTNSNANFVCNNFIPQQDNFMNNIDVNQQEDNNLSIIKLNNDNECLKEKENNPLGQSIQNFENFSLNKNTFESNNKLNIENQIIDKNNSISNEFVTNCNSLKIEEIKNSNNNENEKKTEKVTEEISLNDGIISNINKEISESSNQESDLNINKEYIKDVKCQEINEITENKQIESLNKINTNESSNYQSNQESNYNFSYDSGNYSYNSTNKGYYSNYGYNQNKGYNYNINNRNYRISNKGGNPNKNINYDKRNNQYYKNSGFCSDVHNK